MLSLTSSSLQRWPTTQSTHAKAVLPSAALLYVKVFLASTMSMSRSSSRSSPSKSGVAFILKAAAFAARHLFRPAQHKSDTFEEGACCT